jgi:xanthine dehydrogenase accessory factor
MGEVSENPWSVTASDLRAQLRACRDDGTAGALVTVADVEGSAYRRPGTKMLVTDDGADAFGAVTAGCLEDPVRELAADVIAADTPRVEVFDLMDDDGWGLGLGCNGIIDLLVEPLDASLDRALAGLADGEPVTLVTVLDGGVIGSRTLLTDDGSRRAVPDREPVPETALADAADSIEQLHATGKTRTVEATADGRTVTLLVDSLQPVPELLLFGSQNDLVPLASLAADIGLRVAVHSPRGAFDEGTVPAADRVVTGHPSSLADTVTAPAHTYAVVMSHNLIDDRIAVQTLLQETSVPYVGLMGPRERFTDLREGLAEDGTPLTETELDRLSTPVGLDLGGGEPTEIALSIVSEVLAVSNDREGGRLRDRTGPIHARVAQDSE